LENQDKHNCLDLAKDIAEAANFAGSFTASPAASSTPHLYISVLATWPKHTIISQIWMKHFPFIPFLTSVSGGITMPLIAIQTRGDILSVAFSRDGKHIVSASAEPSVRVWMPQQVQSFSS